MLFDTWLPDLCIFIFLVPLSWSLLYLHDNLLFVTLHITCFLVAFLNEGGETPRAWVDDFITSFLYYRSLSPDPDPICACACLKSTALWSIQNEYWCTRYIYQRHCWSWLLMLSICSCLNKSQLNTTSSASAGSWITLRVNMQEGFWSQRWRGD